MTQPPHTPEELDHILAELNDGQRRNMLLHIDEILNALDTASPAVEQWKTARRHIQLVEENKLAAQAGASIGAG